MLVIDGVSLLGVGDRRLIINTNRTAEFVMHCA